jgi:hypothetical protein
MVITPVNIKLQANIILILDKNFPINSRSKNKISKYRNITYNYRRWLEEINFQLLTAANFFNLV